MKFKIMDHKGVEISTLNAEESVFGIKPNSGAVRQAILSEMTNMRQGTHSAKNRSKVKGGGKKPWKQKGRGVARAGTTRSPLWKGGGVVFGPEPHKYKHKLPKKMSKLARRSVLSDKISKDETFISTSPVNNSLLAVSCDLLTTLPITETTDSGFIFSTVLKKLLLFSITHWVKPK